ncbi:hypothetical protein A0H81_03726 [Grifola frondosa]|uniref:Uncharacterized protein n=1 Tax=Grifola frondosa TaxID=5627 RepID=A0A1C7MJK3_GRIFR|nr:hypothetical protein A0H81_03726 [Grifola frondosa]
MDSIKRLYGRGIHSVDPTLPRLMKPSTAFTKYSDPLAIGVVQQLERTQPRPRRLRLKEFAHPAQTQARR